MRRSVYCVCVGICLLVFGDGVLAYYFETEEERERAEERWKRPSESSLVPLYSWDPEQSELITERLRARHDYYRVVRAEERADFLGMSSAAEYRARLGSMERDYYPRPNPRLADASRIHAPLRSEHATWLFDTGHGALSESPPDWTVIWWVLRIGVLTEHDESMERLMRAMLTHPIPREPERMYTVNVSYALLYIRQTWPEDALEILETALTLPEQPRDRELFPIMDGEPRPAEKEVQITRQASGAIGGLSTYPDERGEALLQHIEAGEEAGKYTLDGRAKEAIERLRERLEMMDVR